MYNAWIVHAGVAAVPEAPKLCLPCNPTPNRYAPAIVELLTTAERQRLGPGHVRQFGRALDARRPDCRNPSSAPIRSSDIGHGMACLAGLWLRHDFLDESHRISQDIENPDWQLLARNHAPPRTATLATRNTGFGESARIRSSNRSAESVANWRTAARSARLRHTSLEQANWDPFAFVDLCELAPIAKQPLGTPSSRRSNSGNGNCCSTIVIARRSMAIRRRRGDRQPTELR